MGRKRKKNHWYHIDTGCIVMPEEEGYETYSSVYDGCRGYSDQYQFDSKNLRAAIKEVAGFKDEENYYLVITDQGEDKNPPAEAVETPIFDGDVNYDPASIVYYEALFNGRPVTIEGAKVKNALEVA